MTGSVGPVVPSSGSLRPVPLTGARLTGGFWGRRQSVNSTGTLPHCLAWLDVMVGHNNWPYTEVPVNIVGWAVRDRNTLQWTDSSVDIFVNNIRENAPQCAEPCGRFFNQNGQYPNCPGGPSHHYDMSLWLTSGFGGSASQITEFDTWMFRDWWRHLKSRYGR